MYSVKINISAKRSRPNKENMIVYFFTNGRMCHEWTNGDEWTLPFPPDIQYFVVVHIYSDVFSFLIKVVPCISNFNSVLCFRFKGRSNR